MLLGFLVPLGLFVTVLPEIYHTANRRCRIWRHLDKVHPDAFFFPDLPDDTPDGQEDNGHAFLLLRRHRYTGTISYYLCWSPGPVPLASNPAPKNKPVALTAMIRFQASVL